MNSKMLLALICVSAATITPACANWFSNPALGINRSVGSAPSPTPEQIRQEKRPPFVLRDSGAAGAVAEASAANQAGPNAPKPAQTVATAAPKR
jgi:hypothetical protein